LDRLPDDVLAFLTTEYLTGDEMCNLLEALHGRRATPDRKGDALTVPMVLRGQWLEHHVLTHFRKFLLSLADVALDRTDMSSSVHAYIDWSLFKSLPAHRAPVPVAVYSWKPGIARRPSPSVILNSTMLCVILRRRLRKCLPCVSVSLYCVIQGIVPTLITQPLLMTSHQLFPAHLL
jgi:hypothetical protein